MPHEMTLNDTKRQIQMQAAIRMRKSGGEGLPLRPSLKVSADPFCGDTPQRPESESADGFSVTG